MAYNTLSLYSSLAPFKNQAAFNQLRNPSNLKYIFKTFK